MRPRKLVLIVGPESEVSRLSWPIWTWGHSCFHHAMPSGFHADAIVRFLGGGKFSVEGWVYPDDQTPAYGPVIVVNGDMETLKDRLRSAVARKRGPRLNHDVILVRKSRKFLQAALASEGASL